MGHVDPHTIKIIPAAAKVFMGAKRYAVVGRVLTDPSRFDNKVGRPSSILTPAPQVVPGAPDAGHPRAPAL